MITEAIKIHDRYQFEVKLNYLFEKENKVSSYKVEFFVFVPNSLGINYSTYSKKDFYSDVQSYIRFKTPVYFLEQIATFSDSPLNKLEKAFRELVRQPNKETTRNYEYHLQMFSSILKSAIRDHVAFITHKKDTNEILQLALNYLQTIRTIITRFRELGNIINVPVIPSEVFSIFLFADEYNSLLIEKYGFRLLNFLDKQHVEHEEFKKAMLDFIAQEIEYRKSKGYESIPSEHSDNEKVIFRFSVLKKYLESVLFVDASVKPEGRLLEQLFMGIAAGIAMLFATTVAFWGHYVYGNYTLPIFITLVISYMFKDRIKELTRIYFTSKVLTFLFDHRIKIYTGKKTRIGLFRESFNFIKRKNIPAAVLKIRNMFRTKEFDNKFSREHVFLYQKQIELSPKIYQKIYHDYPISGINDILRFNVSKFLVKMDNPDKPIFVLTSDGYKQVKAQRVYHLNMIIRYVVKQTVHYARYRIVLTKKGLKRIEKVVTDSEELTS